jgi:hypothetical protein
MNFNFGEHYYNSGSFLSDLLIAIIGGFIGLGTALYIYYIQNKRDKQKEIEKQNKELLDVLTYFRELLLGVVSTIEKQNEKSTEFSEAVKASPHEIQQLKIIASKETERIHNMDSLKIFHAFRHKFSKEKDWIKDFKKLYTALDFIDGHLKEIVTVFENYRDSNYKRLIEIKSIIDSIPTYMANEMLEIRRSIPDYKDDERYKFLNESILQYHKLVDKKAKFIEFNSDFMDSVLKDVVDKYKFEPFATPIANKCKRARVLMTDVKIDSDDTADSIGDSPNLLKDSKEELERIIKRL